MNDTVLPLSAATIAPLTILCVDDEANILNAMRRLLRPHGYNVLTAVRTRR
jgi:response regulator RpfG family c-di-GMP phosphodiesterase